MSSPTPCHANSSTKDPDPPVTVEHHQPDYDDPAQSVLRRIESMVHSAKAAVFLNPIATVSCNEPTQAFFRKARKLQAKWCQRQVRVFERRVLRSPKHYVTWKGSMNHEARYWDRRLSFTGILFLDGEPVDPKDWPDK